jgi:hypothetical protein
VQPLTVSLKNPTLLLLVMTMALALAACAGNGNDVKFARSSIAGTGTSSAGIVTTAVASCGSSAGTVGRIYDDGNLAQSTLSGDTLAPTVSFEDRVRALVSVNYDPNSIGTISSGNAPATTCVTLQGQLQFDAAGDVVAEQSHLNIKIFDSYVNSLDMNGNKAGAYPADFAKAASGTRNSDGTFTVTFTDTLGDVILSGRIDQAHVSGSVRFRNLANVVQGAPNQVGVLGAFLINASSFIK